MRNFIGLGTTLSALLLLGCGGDTSDTSNGGGTSGTGATGGTGAGGGAGGSGATGAAGGTGATGGTGAAGGTGATGGTTGYCPSSPPANGGSCTPPTNPDPFAGGVHCAWGTDPRPECRTTAVCQSDKTWKVTSPDTTACAAPPLPGTCASTPPTNGTQCSDETLSCWYGDGTICWCSPCKGGSAYPVCQTINPPEWFCKAPGTDCPAVIPNAGEPCTTPGASCGPSCELEVVCEAGFWSWKQGNCPICASPDTPIATPTGSRRIADLRVGDLVYSVDHRAIVAVPLLRVGSTPVSGHRVMRVTLDDGTVLEMSPGHPTADGRRFGDLAPGMALDEQHRVTAAELIPYTHQRTYDVLPASETGAYFAGGALVGSTLE